MIYEAIDRWNSPDTYLEHHGVKGMKWGVRKAYHNFQGRRLRQSANKIQEDINSLNNARNKNGMSEKDTSKSVAALEKIRDKQLNKAEQHENYQPKGLTKGQKIAIGIGGTVAILAASQIAMKYVPNILYKASMKPAKNLTSEDMFAGYKVVKKVRNIKM